MTTVTFLPVFTLTLLCCSLISSQSRFIKDDEPAAENDRIKYLPGHRAPLKSQHYAGYINVNEKHDRNLFYYFVQSERNPAADPVVLWLNGGPGCSSFDGFVYEHGPFLFNEEVEGGKPRITLLENPYAWSKVANVIYLDSPVGVGLSYSGDKNYNVSDSQTAMDSNAFLHAWFMRFPSFQSNPFYISGESYAGVYVPMLAHQVMKSNDAGVEPAINLVGYLVGNGCTDVYIDKNALPPFAFGKSLISKELYDSMSRACDGDFWPRESGSTCDVLYQSLNRNVMGLNIYNILDTCYHAPNTSTSTSASKLSGLFGLGSQSARRNPQQLDLEALYQALKGEARWPMPGTTPLTGSVVDNWATLSKQLGSSIVHAPPCTDQHQANVWLNDPAVRGILHAKPITEIGTWEICSDKIQYTRDAGSMVPLHDKLTTEYGLRALIYSGDHDMCVPHTGTEQWTRAMGRSVRTPWQPWFFGEKQVAGYMVEYEGLTYATVKGAGHMVPETNPREALTLFQRFIENAPMHQSQTVCDAGKDSYASAQKRHRHH